MKFYPLYLQGKSRECGFCCVKMVSTFYKLSIKDDIGIPIINYKKGITFFELYQKITSIGLNCLPIKCNYDYLVEEVQLPCIFHWYRKHFAVIYKIYRNSILVADPSVGFIEYTKKEFLNGWLSYEDEKGAILNIVFDKKS